MTYKKIAELAGVSVSTVSKVMSGSHEISRDTAQRILLIAHEHHTVPPRYHRDRVGTRVAIIAPEIVSVFYSASVTAIAAELEARGIVPSVYITNFDKRKTARTVSSIIDSGIDGIISFEDLASVPALPPTVRFSAEPADHGDSIATDYASAIFEAVELLVKSGHTDIGFVGERLTGLKLELFKKAAAGLGIVPNEKNIFISRKRFEQIGYEAVEYYVSRKTLPTALLCAYDEVAMGAVHAFARHGIRVPEDISVIGINDIPFASYANTPLTTISTGDSGAARLAVSMLCERIGDPYRCKPRHVVLKCELVIRDSTADPRKKERLN
ncbi:MAG: LacI family DNA-binding transcriptional regulator [Clostridia bacterium]|nr:LacI family DNA-binding transcriptional regulator [Clostridia bacterium]